MALELARLEEAVLPSLATTDAVKDLHRTVTGRLRRAVSALKTDDRGEALEVVGQLHRISGLPRHLARVFTGEEELPGHDTVSG